MMQKPSIPGHACAIGAVLLGLVHLALSGAPMRYLAINAAALAVGLAIATAGRRFGPTGTRAQGAGLACGAAVLIATAMSGTSIDGLARWVKLGSLSIQPSFVLLPAMVVAYAQRRSPLGTIGIVIAAVALALQPDRGMAGMLAMAMAVLVAMRPDRHSAIALAAALGGFAITLARGDNLPATPYVEGVLASSLRAGGGVEMAVLAGLALLPLPAIAGWRRDPADHAAYPVFAAVWIAAIVAAGVGNYPTPVVGYGGSAIVGYVLSLARLPVSRRD